MTAETHRRVRPATPILLRQDFVGGLVVIAVAVFAFWQGADLPIGTLGGMGPGMLPRGLAVLLGLLGALLVVDALLEGEPRGSTAGRCAARCSCSAPWWHSALAVRPLGLVVAGPLAIVISAFASNEMRWGETLVVRRRDDGVLHRPVQVRARPADPARALAARLLRARRMFDLVGNLGLGFATALTPPNLALCFLGCLVGTLIGVLPGVGPIATIAMLLPLTFKVDPTGALIMLAGIYYGAQYGGSTTAILVNIPGEATSVVTALDGHADGEEGPGRHRARHRGDRLVLRRHRRDAGDRRRSARP